MLHRLWLAERRRMYQHIMVPLDGSELAECVSPHVQAIATGCGARRVTLVSVLEPLHIRGGLESMFEPAERRRLEESIMENQVCYLEQVAQRLNCGQASVGIRVLYGHVADELANYVSESGVDLIIMSTHGRSGVSRWVLGSVADKVLHSSSVPVLMVRSQGTCGTT